MPVRGLFVFGERFEYSTLRLGAVRNLRYDPSRGNPADEAESRLDLSVGGNIAFDYGAKTYRFGSGIDEPEASKIIGLLKSRHHFKSEPSS